MKNIFQVSLNDLSIYGLNELFDSLSYTFKKKSIDYILVGALARDILLLKVYKLELMPRATSDIDIAILVNNWEEYEIITNELIKTQKFKKTQSIHRFIYSEKIEVDIIPFGEIASPNNKIKWPPDYLNIMSMVGFIEVYDNAATIKYDNENSFKIASLEGLIILKLIAWSDRKRQKDAQDISLLLKNCFYVYLSSAEFGGAPDEKENYDLDFTLYGVRMMGNKISLLLKSAPQVKNEIIKILEKEIIESESSRLATEMLESRFEINEKYEYNLKLLKELSEGINEDIISHVTLLFHRNE